MKMTVNSVCESLGLGICNLADGEREIDGVYAGDLLSWVMGHAECSNVLVTIMSNINTLAVAALLDLSCVILSESVVPEEEFVRTAKEKEINVFTSSLTTYELCARLSEILEK